MCQGQFLPIAQNQALFSLLGTTYGGNGQTTFRLPDLRGRIPLGFGQSPATAYILGQIGGAETVTLDVQQLPSHLHAIDTSALTATPKCSAAPADQRSPAGAVPAVETAGITATYSSSSSAPDVNMRAGAVAVATTSLVTGGGQAHSNLQPYLVLTYCIALQGIFPSQN